MLAAIIVLIVFIAFLGWVGWMIYRTYIQRNVWISACQSLEIDSQEAVARVQAMAATMIQKWGYRVTNQGPSNVQYSRTYRPLWLVIPCVIFFPLGLLSLIYRKTVDLAVNGVPDGNGSEVSIVGTGSPFMRDQFDLYLKELSLTDDQWAARHQLDPGVDQ